MTICHAFLPSFLPSFLPRSPCHLTSSPVCFPVIHIRPFPYVATTRTQFGSRSGRLPGEAADTYASPFWKNLSDGSVLCSLLFRHMFSIVLYVSIFSFCLSLSPIPLSLSFCALPFFFRAVFQFLFLGLFFSIFKLKLYAFIFFYTPWEFRPLSNIFVSFVGPLSIFFSLGAWRPSMRQLTRLGWIPHLSKLARLVQTRLLAISFIRFPVFRGRFSTMNSCQVLLSIWSSRKLAGLDTPRSLHIDLLELLNLPTSLEHVKSLGNDYRFCFC